MAASVTLRGDYQLTAKAADAANTNYVFGGRTTGETNAPFVLARPGLSYGTSSRVIIRTDPAGTKHDPIRQSDE